MKFDWKRFLDEHRIPYKIGGKNVQKDWYGLACPLCGDDPSEHLGINPTTGGWSCWRNPDHKGRSPVRLIAALLGVSYQQAADMAGYGTKPDLGTFAGHMSQLRGQAVATVAKPKRLSLPAEFRPITDRTQQGRRLLEYLDRRGFEPPQRVVERFGLLYAIAGKWSGRIIFPIRYDGELAGWTSRLVAKNSNGERYRSLSKELAARNIKDCLFDFDVLSLGGDSLAICEGPFDAAKVSFYGEQHGLLATCLFGLSLSDQQYVELSMLRKAYARVFLLLDASATSAGLHLQRKLGRLIDEVVHLEHGDPGELTSEGIERLTSTVSAYRD